MKDKNYIILIGLIFPQFLPSNLDTTKTSRISSHLNISFRRQLYFHFVSFFLYFYSPVSRLFFLLFPLSHSYCLQDYIIMGKKRHFYLRRSFEDNE